tara:strand:+ start:1421 stop:2086 length:666 start_codon:yes stop_codon:yes gene_type:complete
MWKFWKFKKSNKKAKNKKSKKEGQQDFFEDYEESKKESESKYGFAEGTSFSKRKRKEEKTEKKKAKKEKEFAEKKDVDEFVKKTFRSGADVQVLTPKVDKYPAIISIKIPNPSLAKYIKVNLETKEISLTQDTPKGIEKGKDIGITADSNTKPKITDIKILGSKIVVRDDGNVIYDKRPIKQRKKGSLSTVFKFTEKKSQGLRGYGAKLKKKAGKGLNIEF